MVIEQMFVSDCRGINRVMLRTIILLFIFCHLALFYIHSLSYIIKARGSQYIE